MRLETTGTSALKLVRFLVCDVDDVGVEAMIDVPTVRTGENDGN